MPGSDDGKNRRWRAYLPSLVTVAMALAIIVAAGLWALAFRSR